jgi:hypothetical protein
MELNPYASELFYGAFPSPMRASDLQNISLKLSAEILLKPWLNEADPQA